jgi:NitT/TauT family transport system substrate-binding protein
LPTNVGNEIAVIVVAPYDKKDPQALIARKGQYNDWPDLATAPELLLGKDGQFSIWHRIARLRG